MAKKLYLIDGSGFIFRAFHALPPLQRRDGTPVGAVYGFCTMLFRFLEKRDIEDHHLAVIFDASRQTFRQSIYPLYKAHRPPVPEELIPQFSLIRDACQAFGIPALEKEGFEADDLIASYTHEAVQQGKEVVIVSSDKDLMQLVSDTVSMEDPLKNKIITPTEVWEKFGVAPEKVIDVQALAGDSVDNVPGVPGIGVKTAAELIHTFGDLDSLLEKAESIKQPKRRQLLLEHKENARLSRQLVTLCHTVPLPLSIETLCIQTDTSILYKFLEDQGFTSLSHRFQKQENTEIQPKEISSYHCLTDLKNLEEFVREASRYAVIAVDTETTSLHVVEAKIVGISLSFQKGTGVYIPVGHQKGQELPLTDTSPSQIPLAQVLACLTPLWKDPSILKVGHNLKYDLGVLEKYGVTFTPLADTMVMSYVLDGAKHGHGMDELAQRHLNYKTITYKEVVGTGKNKKTFDEVDIETATRYAAEDADITLQLYEYLSPRLTSEKMLTLYERVERPLIPTLSQMETKGVKVDDVFLHQLGDQYRQEMHALESAIYEIVGEVFNLASPKQLGDILFHKMGLPLLKKTKTGAYGTDADVLETLATQGYLLPEKILEWRQLAKLKSTYVEGLLSAIHPQTRRVHTSYSMAGTSTGRLSSSDPNLQNIPIRTEKGRQIRKAFIAEEGYKLVCLDYSQIELRLLAEIADIPPLSDAFGQGQDIHTITAAQMFGIDLSLVTSELRRRAKAINFGIIYGISAFGLAKQLSISQREAAEYIQSYFKKYPGIRDYMETMKDDARKHGYVETLFGRKCFIPGILDKNANIRGFAERQAINAPLQGTNADLIKKAMNKIPSLLNHHQLGAKMLLQVHDELVFEVPIKELSQTIDILKNLMEGIVHLKVPLVVGVSVGLNWGDAL